MEENSSLKNFYLTYSYIIRKLWFINSILALAALFNQRVDWAIGFLTGSLAAHFFFFMLKRDIENMAEQYNFSQGKAFAGHLVRYLGVGVIFALAISSGFANIITLFTGFFMFHAVLLIMKLSNK